MLVVDLNGDGRNDMIWGQGHNFGLYWEERRDDNKDGSTNWRHHLIDDRFSQPHFLAWEDIDNDGQPELITGRRVKAHSGNDPGDSEPGVIYYFKWSKEQKKFAKLPVAENGPGIGLQIRVADLDGNGWKDIVCAGKSGTHILWNEGK
jgi:FG-GAP-like repeat